MSFISQVLGTLSFRRSTLSEIAKSEELTNRGWILLILSSLIAGLCISLYHPLTESWIFDFTQNRYLDSFVQFLLLSLLIPFLFCFFFGFNIAWLVVALKVGIKGWKCFRDPEFKRSIRLMGYSSLVLLFSSLVLFTGIEFYKLYYILFFFPFLMFLDPFANPIIFFFIWQTILFFYGYNINKGEEKGRNLKYLIQSILIFNFFWFIMIILVIAVILGVYVWLITGGDTSSGSR